MKYIIALVTLLVTSSVAHAHGGCIRPTIRGTASVKQARANLNLQNGPFYGNLQSVTDLLGTNTLGVAIGLSTDHLGVELFGEANMMRAQSSWLDVGLRPYFQVGHQGGLFFALYGGVTSAVTGVSSLVDGELLENTLDGALFFGADTGVFYWLGSLRLEVGPTAMRRSVRDTHEGHEHEGHEVSGTLDQLGLRLSLGGYL